jgi:hypothetical protein
MKRIDVNLRFELNFTTYVARHSSATFQVKGGATLDLQVRL